MKTRGNTLAATLVTVAIILVLVIVFFKGSGAFGQKDAVPERKDHAAKTVMGAVRYAAKDDVCRSNLGQVRSAITIASSSSGDSEFPKSLRDVKLPQEFYACPIGKEPYNYDPQTGKVSCPHPGHESY